MLKEAYSVAEMNADEYGSPRSYWGMSQGLTALSQNEPYTSERVRLDKAAGKILELC